MPAILLRLASTLKYGEWLQCPTHSSSCNPENDLGNGKRQYKSSFTDVSLLHYGRRSFIKIHQGLGVDGLKWMDSTATSLKRKHTTLKQLQCFCPLFHHVVVGIPPRRACWSGPRMVGSHSWSGRPHSWPPDSGSKVSRLQISVDYMSIVMDKTWQTW